MLWSSICSRWSFHTRLPRRWAQTKRGLVGHGRHSVSRLFSFLRLRTSVGSSLGINMAIYWMLCTCHAHHNPYPLLELIVDDNDNISWVLVCKISEEYKLKLWPVQIHSYSSVLTLLLLSYSHYLFESIFSLSNSSPSSSSFCYL